MNVQVAVVVSKSHCCSIPHIVERHVGETVFAAVDIDLAAV
ncbi:hypothetical protein [Spongiibacter tropicus]|nr:hypothetical protein [Spongiibacter tropicus]